MNRNTHRIARASLRVLLLAGCIHSACHLEAAENPKPNIILVMPDDVGPGDYASLGNPVSCLRRLFCVV